MNRSPLRRSRLAAAAALSLAGTILAVSAPPAHADCNRASVWVYKAQMGREYKYGPYQCVGPNHGHSNNFYTAWGTEDDTQPRGTVTGGGYEFWLFLP